MFEVVNRKSRTMIGAILSFFVGLLFVVIPYGTLKEMLFVFIGVGIILINIIPCIFYLVASQHEKDYILPAVLSTISVVVGFVFIFWHHWIIIIILAVWLIVMPVLRIIQAENKKERLKKELPLFIIAALLFFLPVEAILEIVLKIFGIIVMIISVIDIIYILIMNHKEEKNDKDDTNHQNPNSLNRVVIDAEVKDIE